MLNNFKQVLEKTRELNEVAQAGDFVSIPVHVFTLVLEEIEELRNRVQALEAQDTHLM